MVLKFIHWLVFTQKHVLIDSALWIPMCETMALGVHGDWNMPSRSEWHARQKLGLTWPSGNDDYKEALAVQTARKEYRWSTLNEEQKAAFRVACEAGWKVWTSNDAVEMLADHEARRLRAEIRSKKEDLDASLGAD